MSLLRKYKLYRMGIPSTESNTKIFELLDKNMIGLVPYVAKNDTGIYYMNEVEKVCVLRYLKNIKMLYAKHVNFCGFLKEHHKLSHTDTKILLSSVATWLYGLEIERVDDHLGIDQYNIKIHEMTKLSDISNLSTS